MPVNALSLTGSSFRGGVGAGGGLFLSAVAVCGGWGLAAVGWWVWWLGCFLFGVESGYCFLVFRHCGNRCTPGWDEANAGIQSVHVAAAGRPLWVIVVNAVVVGTQEGQVLDVGKATSLPRDQMMDVAVVGWFIAAWS